MHCPSRIHAPIWFSHGRIQLPVSFSDLRWFGSPCYVVLHLSDLAFGLGSALGPIHGILFLSSFSELIVPSADLMLSPQSSSGCLCAGIDIALTVSVRHFHGQIHLSMCVQEPVSSVLSCLCDKFYLLVLAHSREWSAMIFVFCCDSSFLTWFRGPIAF
jgi:hypothetical protein